MVIHSTPRLYVYCFLSINENDKIALMGKNGRWKSLASSTIADITKPSQGSFVSAKTAFCRGFLYSYSPSLLTRDDCSGNDETSKSIAMLFSLWKDLKFDKSTKELISVLDRLPSRMQLQNYIEMSRNWSERNFLPHRGSQLLSWSRWKIFVMIRLEQRIISAPYFGGFSVGLADANQLQNILVCKNLIYRALLDESTYQSVAIGNSDAVVLGNLYE